MSIAILSPSSSKTKSLPMVNLGLSTAALNSLKTKLDKSAVVPNTQSVPAGLLPLSASFSVAAL